MKKLMTFALLAALAVSSVGCQSSCGGGLFGGGLFNRRDRDVYDGCETCCESSGRMYESSYGGEVIVPGPSRIVPGPTTRVLPAPE